MSVELIKKQYPEIYKEIHRRGAKSERRKQKQQKVDAKVETLILF